MNYLKHVLDFLHRRPVTLKLINVIAISVHECEVERNHTANVQSATTYNILVRQYPHLMHGSWIYLHN
jgi:hypothetical protein